MRTILNVAPITTTLTMIILSKFSFLCSTFQLLLSTPPALLDFSSRDHRNALHAAASSRGKLKCVNALLERHPAMVWAVDIKGFTPLHACLFSHADTHRKRQDNNQGSTSGSSGSKCGSGGGNNGSKDGSSGSKDESKDGSNNTHNCTNNTNKNAHNDAFEVVDSLLKACPEAAHVRESRTNLLPLHMAVIHGAPADVVQLILIANQSAISVSGDKSVKIGTGARETDTHDEKEEGGGKGGGGNGGGGKGGGQSDEVMVKKSVSSQGEVLRMMGQLDGDDDTPAAAKRKSTSQGLIMGMMEQVEGMDDAAGETKESLDAAEKGEHNGAKNSRNILTKFLTNQVLQPDLALHMALEVTEPDWDVVVLLLESLPQAASVLDNRSQAPLFVAIRKRAPARVIHALLDAHPGALFIHEPLDVASHASDKHNSDNHNSGKHNSDKYKNHKNASEGMSALQCALGAYTADISEHHASWGAEDRDRGDRDRAIDSDGGDKGERVQDRDRGDKAIDYDVVEMAPGEEAIIAIIEKFPLGAFDNQSMSSLPFDDAIGSGKWGLAKYLLQVRECKIYT